MCKHMNEEMSDTAMLRTEVCPGCDKQRTEKCLEGELSVIPVNRVPHTLRTDIAEIVHCFHRFFNFIFLYLSYSWQT